MSQEEDLQKYMVMIEQYKEQLNQLELQSQYLQALVNDYNKAKITLENIKKSSKESEMLLPIGGSTYINAKAKDTSKVLVDIGAGIVTEKTAEEAIEKIDKRLEEIQKNQEKLVAIMQSVQSEATEISLKAQQIMDEQNK